MRDDGARDTPWEGPALEFDTCDTEHPPELDLELRDLGEPLAAPRRRRRWGSAAVTTLLASMALAQGGPDDAADLFPAPSAGVYRIAWTTPPNADLDTCGVIRVDVEPHQVLASEQVAPSTEVEFAVEIPVQVGQDATIRGYCDDRAGNRRLSSNSARLDWTPPDPFVIRLPFGAGG